MWRRLQRLLHCKLLARRLWIKYCHTRGFFRHQLVLQKIISQPVILNPGCICCDTFCVLLAWVQLVMHTKAVKLSYSPFRLSSTTVSEERQNISCTWQQRGSALSLMLCCNKIKRKSSAGA